MACLLLLAACNKPGTEPMNPSTASGTLPVRITPVITRATETSFEDGDQIGLTITRATGAYVTNEQLTFTGGVFAGNLNWYNASDAATLAAYYPYAASVPASFSVAADQRNGIGTSDFIAAVKEDVSPSANAITMPFQHKLTRIKVTLTNNSGLAIQNVGISGARITANLADDFTATVDESTSPQLVYAYCADESTYYAILPPQTVSLTVIVSVGGNQLAQTLVQTTLAAGKQYGVSIVANEQDIQVVLSGEIDNWDDGGTIDPENNNPGPGPDPGDEDGEYLANNYIVYGGVHYNVVKMDDGKWWMAQNLAYVPTGLIPASDLSAVTAGVFYPLKINAAKDAAEFDTSADGIAAKGFLYQSEVALGLSVGDLTTVAAAQALEGVQGICPSGWHIPTVTDITGLVGKAVSPIATNDQAPYFNGSNGSIALLNADGFNIEAYGGVSIQDNTKTTGTFMGFMSSYPDHLTSCMIIGSTYAGVTYNTSGDETSGIKNLQFYGLMPMTNKSSEADYTCNGTKVSYRIAGPVRCVRNN
jgi:uncharacterized protein (TIGR02145 family)